MVGAAGGVKPVLRGADTGATLTPMGRVAAVDWGRVRVGLAVSDELGVLALAQAPLDGRDRKALLARIVRWAKEHDIERFVVGLPLELSGEQGPAARKAHAFAVELANATRCEVELVDERLTSVEAERRLAEAGHPTRRGRRSRVDGGAAAILLQSWLDARATPSPDDPFPGDEGRASRGRRRGR